MSRYLKMLTWFATEVDRRYLGVPTGVIEELANVALRRFGDRDSVYRGISLRHPPYGRSPGKDLGDISKEDMICRLYGGLAKAGSEWRYVPCPTEYEVSTKKETKAMFDPKKHKPMTQEQLIASLETTNAERSRMQALNEAFNALTSAKDGLASYEKQVETYEVKVSDLKKKVKELGGVL